MITLTVLVTKADGSKQLFDEQKIMQTCMRMGANHEEAIKVARQIERRIYEGITTRKILQMIYSLMRKQKPAVKHSL